MRIILALSLAALGLYGVVIGLFAFRQRSLIYPGVAHPPRQDLAVPQGTQALRLKTADGERLHALWHPPRAGCGIVISVHGNGSRPEPLAARFGAPPWSDAGWGVLAIAYRGYPGSTGQPSEAGLIEDARTAYRYAAEQAPGAPILLHGHSLGTAVAVAIAEHQPHIGLYLEAPFDSMRAIAKFHLPYLPVGMLLKDTYRSDMRIRPG